MAPEDILKSQDVPEEVKLVMNTSTEEKNKLQALLDLSIGLYEAKTFEEIGNTIASNLHTFRPGAPIGGVKLCIYDSELDQYCLCYDRSTRHQSEYVRQIGHPSNIQIPLKDVKYYSKIALEQMRTLVIQDNHSEYSLSIDERQKNLPEQSMIFMPLVHVDKLVGLLSFARSPKNSMDNDFVNFLESIAKYVSITIYNLLITQKREESEEKYRTLFETMAQGVVYHSAEGKIIFANPAAEHILGLSLDQMQGRTSMDPYWRAIHEDGSDFLGETHPAMVALNTGIALHNVIMGVFISKIAEYRWININAIPLFKRNEEKPYRSYSTFEDITERKRAEEALRESEIKYKKMISNISDVIGIIGLDGIIKYKTPNITKFFGWEPDDLIGTDGWETVHPDDLEPIQKEFFNLLQKDNASKTVEYRYKCKDGSYKLIELTAVNLTNDPTINGVLMNYHDITERRLTENKLQENHNLLTNLARLVPGVIYQYKIYPDGRSAFPYASPGINDIYEVTPEEVREDATPVFERLHPEDFDHVSNSIQESSRTLKTFFCEFRVVLPRQGLRWRWSQAQPERTADGGTLWYGIISDITERKLAEEALRESEEKFRQIYNSVNDAVLIHEMNENGPPEKLIIANDSACQMLRYSLEELTSKIPFNEIATQEHSIPLEEIGKGLIAGDNVMFETSLIRKDRVIIPVEINSHAAIIGGKKVLVEVIRDITERKHAEKALKNSESQKKAILDGITTNIAFVDKDLKILWGNKVAAKSVNKSQEEIIGHHCYELWADPSKPCDNCPTLRAFENKKSEHTIMHTPDGRFWDEKGEPVFDSDGNLIGVVEIALDITEKMKAESEHLRLQNLESLGVLAGGIAHDFNNILSSILGQASMVLDDISEGEVKDSLLAIERAAKRATGLTNQLLTFSKGGKPEKKIIILQKLIQDTTKFSLSGSNVEVEYNFRESLKVEADYGQISQVIQNLVINAKQAVPSGGMIKISSEDYSDFYEQKFVKISIEDHGIGIPKEYIDKIFDPYFTLKKTGTGLGLSVCHSIIKRHDGKIFVNSEAGVGTTFTILLPALDKEIIPDDKTKKILNKKLNILIMDDEEEIRDLLSSLLRKNGHDVSVSKNGIEAFLVYKEAKERNESFDLIFLDLTVKGGLGGLETVKILREYDPNIKVIVSSGYADSSVASYKEDGFDGMLKKPYTKNELNDVIFEVMNK